MEGGSEVEGVCVGRVGSVVGVFRFGEVIYPPPAVVMMVVSAVNQAGVEVVEMMVVVVVMVRRKGILILGVMENGVGDFGRRIERLLPVGLGNR